MKRTTIVVLLLLSAAMIGSQVYCQSEKAPAAKTGETAVTEGLEVGNRAPEINLNTPEGTPLALSSLRGKIVLIDFWASWCRPCRMENPNVVQAYVRYKDANFGKSVKGFTVYGVSLDKRKEDWQMAIQKDSLIWKTHVSDLKFWYSEAAQRYAVQSIPTNWLINENGIIIGKNLRGAALDDALKALVKN